MILISLEKTILFMRRKDFGSMLSTGVLTTSKSKKEKKDKIKWLRKEMGKIYKKKRNEIWSFKGFA